MSSSSPSFLFDMLWQIIRVVNPNDIMNHAKSLNKLGLCNHAVLRCRGEDLESLLEHAKYALDDISGPAHVAN